MEADWKLRPPRQPFLRPRSLLTTPAAEGSLVLIAELSGDDTIEVRSGELECIPS